jgi:hypothetical protein
MSALLDLTPAVASRDRGRFGKALETFVHGELLEQATAAEGDYQLL